MKYHACPKRIYIHIPFCRVHCHYCDFYIVDESKGSSDQSEALRESFTQALLQEITLKLDQYSKEKLKFNSVYFGGGTPNLLGSERIERILSKIEEFGALRSSPHLAEVTLEMNPYGNRDRAKAELTRFKEARVNRLSLGLQSLNDDILKWLGREHRREDALETLRLIRETGYDQLTADVIYGIPGLSKETLEGDLKQLTQKFGFSHVSAYCLTLQKGNPFFPDLPDSESARRQMDLVEASLKEEGLLRYEVSNFSAPGRESEHNSSYWKREPSLGFGPSAVSFGLNREGVPTREKNFSSLKRYIEQLSKGELPEAKREVLSVEEFWIEFLYTSLRSREGISLSEIEAQFGPSFSSRFLQKAPVLVKNSYLEEGGVGVLRATPSGWALLDSVVAYLI